jgi:hypothetical protein
MVSEKEYGREHMRRFLGYELDAYLSRRGGELVEELPLMRVEDQDYIHYRKGSLILYRLREEIGEANLNRALRATSRQGLPAAAVHDDARAARLHPCADAPQKQNLIDECSRRSCCTTPRSPPRRPEKRADGKYDRSHRVRVEEGRGRRRRQGVTAAAR